VGRRRSLPIARFEAESTVRNTTMKHMLLGLAMLIPVPSAAQQPPGPPSNDPVVVASGQGVVLAVPDRAWITIGAESRASSPREAQRLNAEAMRPVQEKLRGAGIPSDAVRTASYDLQEDVEFVNNKRVRRGYIARNAIEVRVDTIDRVGEYLDMAVGSGATSVSGIRFDLKDQAKLEREALRLAVADARAKVEAAAAGAGRTIDRIVRIEEQGIAVPIPMRMAREIAAATADAAPPISAGQTEIRARATVTASMK
jgi:uncharacterized protein YggE